MCSLTPKPCLSTISKLHTTAKLDHSGVTLSSIFRTFNFEGGSIRSHALSLPFAIPVANIFHISTAWKVNAHPLARTAALPCTRTSTVLKTGLTASPRRRRPRLISPLSRQSAQSLNCLLAVFQNHPIISPYYGVTGVQRPYRGPAFPLRLEIPCIIKQASFTPASTTLLIKNRARVMDCVAT